LVSVLAIVYIRILVSVRAPIVRSLITNLEKPPDTGDRPRADNVTERDGGRRSTFDPAVGNPGRRLTEAASGSPGRIERYLGMNFQSNTSTNGDPT